MTRRDDIRLHKLQPDVYLLVATVLFLSCGNHLFLFSGSTTPGFASPFPHQLRHRHSTHDVFDLVSALLRFGLDGVEIVLVVKGEGAAKAIRAEVLDEGAGEFVAVFEEALFEFVGVFEGATVGHGTGGIDQRIFTDARRDFLTSAPLADGIVVVPCEAQRVDLGMAGSAVGIFAVGFELIPESGLGALRRWWLDGGHIRRRWGRWLAEHDLAEPHTAMHRTVPRSI